MTTATLHTSHGPVDVELFDEDAPKTVQNFLDLTAKGFYDGITFHRVIPDFMIQGGCPLGTGTGGPGYEFEDEHSASLRFDRPGKLAMANAGPNTNGSQFFLTVAATPWLNSKHTIFGETIEGQEVVVAISNAPKDTNDRPRTPIVIKKLEIVEVK